MKILSLKKVVLAFSSLVTFAVFYRISIFLNDDYLKRQDRLHQTTRNEGPLVQVPERLILILITSAPFHAGERQTVRQTWLSLLVNNSVALERSNVRAMKNPKNASNNDLAIHYWFVCGHYYDKEKKVEAAVENESKVYGDILRLNYTEAYSLLVYKTLRSLTFAATMDVQFVVKVDDDVYLHVPKLVWWLKTAPLPDKLYAGYLLNHSKAIRNTKHKWHVSEQYFKETYFPPYCNGPFYILSKNVVLDLLKASSSESDLHKSFPLEDVYIGILAKRAGIKPIQLKFSGVRLEPRFPRRGHINWKDSVVAKYFALGHGLSAEQLFGFHKRFLELPLIMPSNSSRNPVPHK